MIPRFHPASEVNHLGQIQFYESRHRGLGARYHEHFLRTMARIYESPERSNIEHPPDVRRALFLGRFPLSVIYRERHGIVQVLAVMHHRRRPDYWRLRAR